MNPFKKLVAIHILDNPSNRSQISQSLFDGTVNFPSLKMRVWRNIQVLEADEVIYPVLGYVREIAEKHKYKINTEHPMYAFLLSERDRIRDSGQWSKYFPSAYRFQAERENTKAKKMFETMKKRAFVYLHSHEVSENILLGKISPTYHFRYLAKDVLGKMVDERILTWNTENRLCINQFHKDYEKNCAKYGVRYVDPEKEIDDMVEGHFLGALAAAAGMRPQQFWDLMAGGGASFTTRGRQTY